MWRRGGGGTGPSALGEDANQEVGAGKGIRPKSCRRDGYKGEGEGAGTRAREKRGRRAAEEAGRGERTRPSSAPPGAAKSEGAAARAGNPGQLPPGRPAGAWRGRDRGTRDARSVPVQGGRAGAASGRPPVIHRRSSAERAEIERGSGTAAGPARTGSAGTRDRTRAGASPARGEPGAVLSRRRTSTLPSAPERLAPTSRALGPRKARPGRCWIPCRTSSPRTLRTPLAEDRGDPMDTDKEAAPLPGAPSQHC